MCTEVCLLGESTSCKADNQDLNNTLWGWKTQSQKAHVNLRSKDTKDANLGGGIGKDTQAELELSSALNTNWHHQLAGFQ